MTIMETIRDAPAGQLARAYLDWTIAPYEDEKDNFQLPHPEKNTVNSQTPAQQRADSNVASIEHDKETRGSSQESIRHQPPAERDIERVPTEKDEHGSQKPAFNEVAFTPSDRDNPHNWGTGKKVFVFSQICLLTFSSKQTPARMSD